MFVFRHSGLDISLTFRDVATSANLDCISLMIPGTPEREDQEDCGHEEHGRHHLSQGPHSGAVSPPGLVRSLFGKDVRVFGWYDSLD